MKELFKSYQTLITNIENRISYIDALMREPSGKERLKELRMRREALKEEYDELILSLHDMAKYIDEREKPDIRRRAA